MISIANVVIIHHQLLTIFMISKSMKKNKKMWFLGIFKYISNIIYQYIKFSQDVNNKTL
jgi:hypothetical protein